MLTFLPGCNLDPSEEEDDEQDKEVEYDVEECNHFAMAVQEDKDEEDVFDVPGLRVVADMVLAKTLSMYLH